MVIGKPPFETNDVKTTYKKIKMNAYQFPESIQISDSVKNLITKILVLDPTKRPSLKDILDHPFMSNHEITVPPLMPPYTLACPLSKKFFESINSQFIKDQPVNRLESTAPLKKAFSSMSSQRNPNQKTIGKMVEEHKGDAEGNENLSSILLTKAYSFKINMCI
jgi:polo-like kinase 1